jgi:GDPmannose 4,6-dehydratase
MNALIFGITGQDGSLLAKFLLKKGYKVVGTSRNPNISNCNNLVELEIYDKVIIEKIDVSNYNEVLQIIKKYNPNELYNLSGQSSVGKSYNLPVETFESIVHPCKNVLEAIRILGIDLKYFNASSSDCFGDSKNRHTENSEIKPVSPYGMSKSTTNLIVKSYRESYGIFACSGILSNHEYYFRNSFFITKKIVDSAVKIYKNELTTFNIGNIEIIRDWGWAEEYVEAMYLSLQHKKADDYIISTGKSISLIEFLEYTFKKLNLDYRNHIIIDNSLFRQNEIYNMNLNPDKAKTNLGWFAKKNVYNVIDNLLEYSLQNN